MKSTSHYVTILVIFSYKGMSSLYLLYDYHYKIDNMTKPFFSCMYSHRETTYREEISRSHF